jgi:hypothetical protein
LMVRWCHGLGYTVVDPEADQAADLPAIYVSMMEEIGLIELTHLSSYSPTSLPRMAGGAISEQ